MRIQLSPAAFHAIDGAVRNVLTHQRLFWVSAGLVLTVWELSGGARGVMDALDEIYDSPRRRRFGERFWRSVWLGAAAGTMLVGAFASVIVLTTFLYLSAIVFLGGALVDALMRRRANGKVASP